MKIKDLLYQTPEMSEEKLLELIKTYYSFLPKYLRKRILSLHKEDLEKGILKEFDLIQEKQSFLTKGERDKVMGLVSMCLLKMTKGDD